MTKILDVITIGRTSVDLYGEQMGERLEDMMSFAKYVGGSPTNAAIGAARLGLNVGHITGVGDEPLGNYIIEYLESQGVDTKGIKRDATRLTSTTVLGVNGKNRNTLVYFRTDCADAALGPEDIDPAYILSAGALLVSGTMFYTPGCREAAVKAIAIARKDGMRVILDIDYRPRFLGPDPAGRAGEIAAAMKEVLGDVSAIVGTEEEFGMLCPEQEDAVAILKNIRTLTPALLVYKCGAQGCRVFEGEVSANLDDGLQGTSFSVEVCNVFGAGDAFMGGFLRGWLRGEPMERVLTWANACGAIVVSRHGCSPESPSWPELEMFMGEGFTTLDPESREQLEHVHYVTTWRKPAADIKCLAIDHQWQFRKLMAETGCTAEDVCRLKRSLYEAALEAARGHANTSILVDDTYCKDFIPEIDSRAVTVMRRTEAHYETTEPIRFLHGPAIGATMRKWPRSHVAKLLVYLHPDNDQAFIRHQVFAASSLHAEARSQNRELLLEPIPSLGFPITDDTAAWIMETLYKSGIKPDYWKIDLPESPAAWNNAVRTMKRYDPYCKGFLLLGKMNSLQTLCEAFSEYGTYRECIGFAIGRPAFWEAARAWMYGETTSKEVIEAVSANYAMLLAAWDRHRK